MFTLTYVGHEYETSISIWEFEMMIVQKSVFLYLSSLNT